MIVRRYFLLVFFFCFSLLITAQSVPAIGENIPYLVTFGKEASKKFGDDDFTQVFFFIVPKSQKNPIYIRIFDPGVGGEHDEINGVANTTIKYSIYGGLGCVSNKDAQNVDPIGNFQSGILLGSKTFSDDIKYDNKWYTFGPFNPAEGEDIPQYGGYIFKVICQGTSGDDGNLYRYFMSIEKEKNITIEGGNVFTFEYSFRLHNTPDNVSHIYPYIDDKVESVRISNFDMDLDGLIRIVSVDRNDRYSKLSNDNVWIHDEHIINKNEQKTSLDIQFIKDKKKDIKNNNVVVYVTNQYGEYLPFYVIPIGGVPHTGHGILHEKTKQ